VNAFSAVPAGEGEHGIEPTEDIQRAAMRASLGANPIDRHLCQPLM
jgi:hypothetical protein